MRVLLLILTLSSTIYAGDKFEALYSGENHQLKNSLYMTLTDFRFREDRNEDTLRGNGGSITCDEEGESCILELDSNPTRVENNHSIIRYIMNASPKEVVDARDIKGLKIRSKGEMDMETGEFKKPVYLIGSKDQDHMICTDRAVGGSTLSFGNDYQCQVFPAQ